MSAFADADFRTLCRDFDAAEHAIRRADAQRDTVAPDSARLALLTNWGISMQEAENLRKSGTIRARIGRRFGKS